MVPSDKIFPFPLRRRSTIRYGRAASSWDQGFIVPSSKRRSSNGDLACALAPFLPLAVASDTADDITQAQQSTAPPHGNRYAPHYYVLQAGCTGAKPPMPPPSTRSFDSHMIWWQQLAPWRQTCRRLQCLVVVLGTRKCCDHGVQFVEEGMA